MLCRDVFIFSAVGSTSLPNSQIKKNGIHNADNTFPYNIGACFIAGRMSQHDTMQRIHVSSTIFINSSVRMLIDEAWSVAALVNDKCSVGALSSAFWNLRLQQAGLFGNSWPGAQPST